MKKMAALIAAAAALSLAPRHAAAQTLVTCESRDGDREICRVDTRGGVSIRQQLSATNCVAGRNWGYSRSAIWVDDGCRAQFVVGAGQSTRYYNSRSGNVYANTRSMAAAEALCRRAVLARTNGRANVETWMVNATRTNLQVGWRFGNGRSGECSVDRQGNVAIQVNRR